MDETSEKGFMSMRRLRHGSELVLIAWLWVLDDRERERERGKGRDQNWELDNVSFNPSSLT